MTALKLVDSPAGPDIEFAVRVGEEIRRAVSGNPVGNPYAIASDLVAGWSDQECRAAISALLPSYIRDRLTSARRTSEPQLRSTAPRNHPTTAQRVNSWYTQTLAAKVAVGDGDDWKYLADCTANDLVEASARLHTKALRLNRLADAVRGAGVRTVGNLGETALREALGSS